MSKTHTQPSRFYWDSCVFLSAINGPAERLPVIKAILEDCEQGQVELFTSMLSIAEVAFAETEKLSRLLDKDIE